ncbi:hypothetical protein PR202_gb12547 [Eleusine coracana subsp. coracana]|uniref:Uncharacterized protein n=1 Tax=Eleusine coracana subsp. coracana TaxID=191504 RepID=A0AAV5EQJ1_ELECO|nr:hypothetical protein QOZ80_7BG0590380 [Eleusine coracana subsp. coracana]GJN24784.1 hypothetical protein PR202_gb12547 [Eleusine coracana subsp. coracana]
MAPPHQLLLLPLLLAAAVASAAYARTTLPSTTDVLPRAPTPWPEQFHAVMFTNLTESGGRLQLIDLYYDWPRGRNLNLIRDQLSGDPTYDVEWTNGTSFIFDSATCRTIRFPVGLLPPDWLAGATYLGRESVDGFDCHLWTKVDFVWYYEEVATGRPVRWNFFNGMQQHVMSFEVGGVLEDSEWQAPAHCFNGDNAAATSVAGDRVDSKGGRVDVMNSLIRFAGAPAASASF